MMGKKELAEQLADLGSFLPEELKGENVEKTLLDEEKAGRTIYWGAIDPSILDECF